MPRPTKVHAIDVSVLQDMLGGSVADPRTWVSYGTVEIDQDVDEGRAVAFDEDLGPTVEVRLHPSDKTVTCRVSGSIAGPLEGQWEPFVGGDEVIVLLPEGSEMGPPCIVGRLNNGIDKFPPKVSGKDTDLNNLSFKRMRSPHITETASLYMIRSAVTGAMFGIDEAGNITIRDGESNGLQFGPSGFAVQDGDGTGQITLNVEEGYASIWWEDTLLKLDGMDINMTAAGNISIGSAGNTPVLHAASSEQVMNLLIGYIQALAITLNLPAYAATPLTGSVLASIIDPLLAPGNTIFSLGIAESVLNANPALLPTLATLYGAIRTPNPITPITPGVGCPGIVIG